MHQITIRGANTSQGQAVSCVCKKANPFGRRGRGRNDQPMGIVPTWAESVALYNNPENHEEPFEDKDKLRGTRY